MKHPCMGVVAMNYTEIKDLALSFADRTDADTENNVDGFFRMVESRVNRKLRTMGMSTNHDLLLTAEVNSFVLPSGFGGARNIAHVDGDKKTTIKMVTPEKLDELSDIPNGLQLNATNNIEVSGYIDSDTLYFWPPLDSGKISLLYYMKVPEITAVAPTNWLSDDYPDVYINGLCKEIAAFNKDRDAKLGWDEQFKLALAEIKIEDKHNRWSGAPMQMQTA